MFQKNSKNKLIFYNMLDSITLLHTQGQYIYICISKVSVNLKKKKKYSIIITDSLYISCLLTMLWIFFMQFNFSKNKFYKFFSHKTDLISVKTIPFQKELQFFWKSINWSNYEYWKHNQWKKDTPHSPRKYTT